MTYHPPTIENVGVQKWIDDNTNIGYKQFMEFVVYGMKPAQIARKCGKDSRTIRDWLTRIARDKGHKGWRDLYKD